MIGRWEVGGWGGAATVERGGSGVERTSRCQWDEVRETGTHLTLGDSVTARDASLSLGRVPFSWDGSNTYTCAFSEDHDLPGGAVVHL